MRVGLGGVGVDRLFDSVAQSSCVESHGCLLLDERGGRLSESWG